MKKILVANLALLVVVIIAGTYAYVRFWNVATVNGMGISRIDYIKAMEKQGGKQTLDSMIDDALVLNEGAAKGVRVEQKVIDEEIATIETKLKAQNETLDSALKAANMTKDDLIKQIRMKKIQDALSAPKVEITQAQIDDFLKANKDRLPTGQTKEQLETLAKNQLALEASQSAASTWLESLRKSAKIVYR